MYLTGMIADPKAMTEADSDKGKLNAMLEIVEKTIHDSSDIDGVWNYIIVTKEVI